MKKYEFTGETKEFEGHVLHRIRRLSNRKLGGWIEKEDNLSHEGQCWVHDEAMVFQEARIFEDAKIFGQVKILGHARAFGHVEISGDTEISGGIRL